MDKEELKKRRPHHRPVMLTIKRSEYDELKLGYSRTVACVNDIVRTSRCGAENEHHWERRVETVAAALCGDFKKMNARWSGDHPAIKVEVLRLHAWLPDDPIFRVDIKIINEK